MNVNSVVANNSKYLPLLGVGLAAFFWVVDSAIDVLAFEEHHTFVESLFNPEPVELWMRILVAVILVVFSIYARMMLASLQRTATELTRYKRHLEQLVDERTEELQEANRLLNDEIEERKKAEAELEKLAATDPLTLLYNRRKFEAVLDYEIERDKRYRTGLSIILCDVDRFKAINDECGHDVGDDVLRVFSQLLRNNVRTTDIVARWGGEEFVLLVPNTTVDTARLIAEGLRKKIEAAEFPVAGQVTASFGVTHMLGSDDKSTLTKRADEALYRAKQNGRNRVEFLADDLGFVPD